MDNPSYTAVVPLFNFWIREILIGNYSQTQIKAHLKKVQQRDSRGMKILDHVKLKKITAEEFQRIIRFGFGSPQKITSGLRQNMYALEISSKEGDPAKLKPVADKVLLAFRLYKPDLIFCKFMFIHSESPKDDILVFYDPPLPEIPLMPKSYLLEIDEVKEISALAKILDATDFAKRISLRIAGNRLNRSYIEREEDDRIIDYMIGLEALFLRGKNVHSRIGQHIGVQCSKTLGKTKEEKAEIREFLNEAYKIRNSIIHSLQPITSIEINNKKYEMKAILIQLQNYLRKSIKAQFKNYGI